MNLLGSGLFQALSFLLVVGVVVVFHELGHFVACRIVGVRVDVFSVGFGRRLFGKKLGDTDYRVSLIPLGGYVKMHGDGSEGELTGDPSEFESRRTWERIFIMAAGPAFNGVLAVLLLSLTFMVGFRVPAWLGAEVRVESVDPKSPAAEAGIVAGDVVRAVDGEPVPDWETFQETVLVRPDTTVELTVERDGQGLVVPVDVVPRGANAVGYVGVEPCHRIELRKVSPKGAASDAGLKPGDFLLELEGERLCTAEGLIAGLQERGGRMVELTVGRDETQTTIEVVPRWNDVREQWVIGVAPIHAPRTTVVERRGPVGALAGGLERTWRYSGVIVESVVRLVTGRLSLRAMSGPVEIASIASVTVQLGIVPFLQLLSLISLSIGIMNLLPIPLLDGGRIALLLVEAVRGRELEQRTKEWILQAGFVSIVVLMAVILFLDIVKKLES